MAALAETRDAGSTLALPDSIRRICCLGDSLTYGQGVSPRQTLPMHVARFANMAYPDHLIWVDNRGQSSGNIWHSWVPFARLIQSVRYDAAIFSICHNDAQVFESNTVRYGKEANANNWHREGKLVSNLRTTIADLARVASEQRICLILDFYSRWEKDASLVEMVAQECAGAGVPFVDLLRFLKDESGLAGVQHDASPFDQHPSEDCHRAAARRLVDELRLLWKPQTSAGGTVGERLLLACDEAVQAGWPADEILDWALLVLEAKETIARRQRSDAGRAVVDDLARARANVEDRYRRWYIGRAAVAQAQVLHERRDEVSRLLEGAYASNRNLGEMVFALDRFSDGPTAAEFWRVIEEAGYYSREGRLQPLPVDAKARFLSLADKMLLELPRRPLPPLQDFAILRREFVGNLRHLAGLLPDRFPAEALDPGFLRLWQVAFNLVNAARSYLEGFEKMVADTAVATPDRPAFHTGIAVRVERDKDRPRRGGLFNLTVEIDYLEPLRARKRVKLYGGADEDAYVYKFGLPLLLLGDVSVGVPIWDGAKDRFLDGELRLARVEIVGLSFKSDETGSPFVWQPSTSEPIAWLKLERVLVSGRAG